MRSQRCVPPWARTLLSFPAVLIVALSTGCGQGADSPEVKKEIQERTAAIKEDEAKDNAAAKDRRGRPSAVGKSIKGRLGSVPD